MGIFLTCILFPLKDAIDLFLGNYIVDATEGVSKPSPLNQRKDWKYMLVSTNIYKQSFVFIWLEMYGWRAPGALNK